MQIYMLPGLAFDKRIYQKWSIEDWNVSFLDWIEPKKNESFRNYAIRMADEISERDETITLIGHSMGGMLAQEIATIRKVRHIVLISSIKSRAELPLKFKVVQPLRIHHLFTKAGAIHTLRFWGKYHDYVSIEEQALFREMVGRYSNHYLQWALRQLSIWHEPKIPSSTRIFHIHGMQDRTLPVNLIQYADLMIEDAGHFMVYKRGKELKASIAEFLSK